MVYSTKSCFRLIKDLLPLYADLLDSISCCTAPRLSHAVLSRALKSKAGLDQSSQWCNMSALCMNHVNLLWWAVLCAKCKWCFLPSPGVTGSLDTRWSQLSWWYKHTQGGGSWLNNLGIPHISPPLPHTPQASGISHWVSSSLRQSCQDQPFCLPLPASISILISQRTPSHYTEGPLTGALSRSFISVIASQQACGSPSQNPLTLTMVGERMADLWGIDED